MASKYLQLLVYFNTLFTNELDALSAKCCGLVSRATLTDGFHFALCLRELGVNCFHAVDEEGRFEAGHAPLREGGV